MTLRDKACDRILQVMHGRRTRSFMLYAGYLCFRMSGCGRWEALWRTVNLARLFVLAWVQVWVLGRTELKA
jgi:hypothetical protein